MLAAYFVRKQCEKGTSIDMIKNVIFDVGKVLVEWEPLVAMKKLGMDDATARAVAAATTESPDWNESDRGAVSDEKMLAKLISNAPEYEKEIRLFWDNVGLPIYQYDYVRSWIRSLKEKGYGVYILSNYGSWTYAHTTEQLSFLEDVDGAVFSFQVKQIKPEPEIYQSLLAKYGLNPEECVFLDDRQENIDAAKAQKIEGIVFTSYEEAVEALKTYGVE